MRSLLHALLSRRIPAPRLALIALLSLSALPLPLHAQTTFSAAGANGPAIQATVDAFRAALGPLNANVSGSFGSGRREINWDGVPDASSDPNMLPANFFNVNSPRGVVFSTPGTGFLTSATAGGLAPVNFGSYDPFSFVPFSAQRLFTAAGSNIIDVNFFVPGSTTAATTRGFGAVFSDVDLANTTSIQFFNASNVSLGTFFAPSALGSAGFSFLGVTFTDAIVARVRITAGNSALSLGLLDQNGNSRDLVVMDDFIYGEPLLATTVPEPGTLLLVSAGVATLLVRRRRRN